MKQKTLQHFKDLDETLSVGPQKMDQLCQTAVASKALQDDEKQEEEEEHYTQKKEKEKKKKERRRLDVAEEKEERIAMGKRARYAKVEQTKEYQETYYWNVLYETNTANIVDDSSKFWCDFASYLLSDGDMCFVQIYCFRSGERLLE
eukprot:633626_1